MQIPAQKIPLPLSALNLLQNTGGNRAAFATTASSGIQQQKSGGGASASDIKASDPAQNTAPARPGRRGQLVNILV